MSARRSVSLAHPNELFIGGEWMEPSSNASFEILDASLESVFLTVPEAGTVDVERAVASARFAFDDGPWSRLRHEERAEFLRRFAGELRARAEDVAQLWPRQSGVLYSAAAPAVEAAARSFEYYADLASSFPFELTRTAPEVFGTVSLRQEPVGVVAAIIPWNAPLSLLTHKVAPALLAGCTVVIKASPEAPGEAYLFAEIADAIGIPRGVVNVLTADRAASEGLVTDSRVDMVTFTGSTVAGYRIASLVGSRMGRYAMELGGMSPAVVFDDADLELTTDVIAGTSCRFNGQLCSSLTRIVVTRRRHDELVARLRDAWSALRVGDPFEEGTRLGPLATDTQRERVEGYIQKGLDEGADLVLGGGRPEHLSAGYFIEPTIFGGVRNESALAQQEVFGPVLAVIPVDGEEDLVPVANATTYGLNASVFTSDRGRARQAAESIRSGTVAHNSFRRADFSMPVGGFKSSGVGREGGEEGLRPYLEVKSIFLDE